MKGMNLIMEYKSKEIKKGIKVHYIKTDLFKTDLISVFITRKLNRDTVTKNTLIPAVLTSGTRTMPTQESINKEMEELYGALMDCGIEKVGDNQLLKFYIESINNKYVLTDENLIESVINKLLEIVFEPLLENGIFKNPCTASVWMIVSGFCAFTNFDISPIGFTAPVSLFTSITDTSTVSGRSSAITDSGVILPKLSGFIYVTS